MTVLFKTPSCLPSCYNTLWLSGQLVLQTVPGFLWVPWWVHSSALYTSFDVVVAGPSLVFVSWVGGDLSEAKEKRTASIIPHRSTAIICFSDSFLCPMMDQFLWSFFRQFNVHVGYSLVLQPVSQSFPLGWLSPLTPLFMRSCFDLWLFYGILISKRLLTGEVSSHRHCGLARSFCSPRWFVVC